MLPDPALVPDDVMAVLRGLRAAGKQAWLAGGAVRDLVRRAEGLYVGEENETVAGIVWFLPEPVFAEGGLVILLAVRPEMRRRGIARQLLGFTERKIFNQSQSSFFSISSHNNSGLQFLEKMGYTKVSEIPSPVGSGDAHWIFRKTAQARKNAR